MYYKLNLKKFDDNQNKIAQSNKIKILCINGSKVISESQKPLLTKVRKNLKKQLGKQTPVLEGNWVADA
jgi:hypothetical protein